MIQDFYDTEETKYEAFKEVKIEKYEITDENAIVVDYK